MEKLENVSSNKETGTPNKEPKIVTFNEDDVYGIKNPAFVVKGEKKDKKGGCVVTWNEEFEKLTNFTPSEIDNGRCYLLFEGAQKRGDNRYYRVCCENCVIRIEGKIGKACVLKDFWINSIYTKDSHSEFVKRCVDAYVFPFDKGEYIYALHILVDKGGVHEYIYFENKHLNRTKDELKSSLEERRKKRDLSRYI